MAARARKGVKKPPPPMDDMAFEKVRRGELVLANTERLLAIHGFTVIESVPCCNTALREIFCDGNESYTRPFIRAQKTRKKTTKQQEKVVEEKEEKEGEEKKEEEEEVVETCLVFVAPHIKLRIDSVRDYDVYIQEYSKSYGSNGGVSKSKTWAIVLSYETPSTVAIGHISQKNIPLHVLSFGDMGQLAIEHSLAPKVRPLTAEETAKLCRELGIANAAALPKLETGEIMCKLHGFEVGTVLEMQLPATPLYYRVVVHPH